MIQSFNNAYSSMKKHFNLFKLTLFLGVLFLVFAILDFLFNIVDDNEFSQIADGVTFMLALVGFYLLIKRFDVQQRINNKTISKYSKDKIEQQFFKLLELHSKNIERLRNTRQVVRQTNTLTLPVLEKFKIQYDVIYSTFLFLKEIGFEDFNWKQVNAQGKVDDYLDKNGIKNLYQTYQDLNTEWIKVSGSTLSHLILRIMNNIGSFEDFQQIDLSNLKDIVFQILFLGSNRQNFNRLAEKEDKVIYSIQETQAFLNIPSMGYQNELAPFFKVYYHAVSFIDNHPRDELNYTEKYRYIKMLRGQMNTLEFAIFYYNSLSRIGRVWENPTESEKKSRNLNSKYNLIKNLPAYYCTYGLDPSRDYPDITFEGKNDTAEDRRKHFEKYDQLDKETFG